MTKTKTFNDMAMIGHNPKTGRTCFFQNSIGSGKDGSKVPHPADVEKSTTVWSSYVQNYCSGTCHAESAFVHSPWIDGAKRANGKPIVPKMGEHPDFLISDLSAPVQHRRRRQARLLDPEAARQRRGRRLQQLPPPRRRHARELRQLVDGHGRRLLLEHHRVRQEVRELALDAPAPGRPDRGHLGDAASTARPSSSWRSARATRPTRPASGRKSPAATSTTRRSSADR